MPPVYYSPLSTLVPTDAFPEALGFVKDGLSSLLADLYFKDLQQSSSPRGDAAQYSLTIVSQKALEVEVPGTGFFLVINPSHMPGGTSEFPISVRYEWGVLTWLRDFDLESFSFQPGDLYQLALTLLGLTDRQVVERALSVFVGGLNPIDQFVDDVNAFYNTTIPHPVGADPLGAALAAIEAELGEGSAVTVFAIYILDNADIEATGKRLEALFGSFFGGSLKDYLLKLITPRIEATLTIGAGIRFPRSVLVPLDAIGGHPLPEPASSMLVFDAGSFYFSTQKGIGFDETLAATLTPSQIGDTGFEISITGAKLDLSRTSNIPEATADGRPEDFVGVFIKEAIIKLPSFFNEDPGVSSGALTGRNLLIGTGGLSGTIGLEAVNPTDTTPALIRGRFGAGFELGLSAVSVTFKQNAITGSEIRGYMMIPGFKDTEGHDAEVQIAVSIGTDGAFSVTASEEQGIRALSIPNVVDLVIDSLAAGRKGDRFFVAVSGALDFADQGGAIGKFIPDKIDIQKLLIWDDGQVELEGGTIALPQAATLKIGPVEIAITAIHFGALEQEHNGQQRKYAFFGFDGGLSVDPGGVDARGDGIKFYFTTDVGPGKPLHVFMRIQSISVDIIIPDSATPEEAAVLLRGYLSMKDGTGGETEYIGGVAVSLPKLKIAGTAAMRYNPRLPSFIIDLGLELATPIVLGATGLGIYGFRALAGFRYVAKKTAAGLTEDAEWWQYYKAKIAPDFREGIQVSKFAAQEGFSLGAGLTLATVPDAGHAFSSKLFFLLSLPEVFLLQGQGQILKQRIGLDTTQDPPFFALIAITSQSIETAFGVDYKIPDSGDIARIGAVLEMGYFWDNAGAWYINLGRDQPEDRRVRALLLKIFDCYFYLMLSSGGIRTGAGVKFELDKRLGPFHVELGAFLDVAGRLSFNPQQLGGSIELGGHLGLSIFGIGFSLSASAALSGESPHPFIVTGRLKACVKILWSKHCVTIELTWTFDGALNYAEIEVLPADPTRSVQAINVQTLESFPLYAAKGTALPSPAALSGYVIPMDSYIDIEFRQGVKPTGAHPSLAKFDKIGGSADFSVLIPPQKAKSSQVRHEFELGSIEIMSWNPATSAWAPYDPYQAATPLQVAPFVTADLSSLPYGYWQKTHPTIHNKLRVFAQTPFSYMRPGVTNPPPQDLGVGVDDVFCAPEKRSIECRDFTQVLRPDQQTSVVTAGLWYSLPNVLYRVEPNDGEVRRHPRGLIGLCVDQDSTIRLLFPEPTARVQLLLQTEAAAVEVVWYRRVPAHNPHGQAPLQEWQQVRTVEVAAADLTRPVEYDDLDHPILRADIRGVRCSRKPTGGVDTKTLAAIERFLSALARNGDLARERVTLYPESPPLPWWCVIGRLCGAKTLQQHTYYGSYLNSPLYQLPNNVQWVRYEAVVADSLKMRVFDSREYLCQFELLALDRRDVDWRQLRDISNLRAAAGERDGFEGEAKLADGTTLRIQGRSCHVVQEPPGGELPLNCEVIDDGRRLSALLAFLNHLAQHKHLTAPQLSLNPVLRKEYGDVFLESPLYRITETKARRVLYEAAWDRRSGPLQIRIRDFMRYDCTISLASADRQILVSFDRIEAFVSIRLDPANTGEGENFYFLILARIDGREVWLRGTSCYPLGECHRGCRTCLYRVCWETVEAAIYNDSLPTDAQVEEDAQAMIEALSGSIQPIWRPDTYFAMRITASDTAYRHDDGTVGTAYNNTFMVGWRTVGPIGHFHRYLDAGGGAQTLPAYAALEAAGHADEFKLASLLHYLDVARCYPNADGRLTRAKPLFYVAPRFDLFYLQPYVYEMYGDWDVHNGAEKIWSSLELEIVDPAPPPAAPAVTAEADWAEVASVRTSPDVAVINGMIVNGDPCADVSPADPIDVGATFPVDMLEPNKLYTAVFRNVFRRDSAAAASKHEVHRYVFQTSRYPNFGAQVESWILEEEAGVVLRGAVYDVEVGADNDALTAATAVLADPSSSSDDLKQRFADPFDRLIDGILKLGALPPAVTTEFNVLRLSGTPRVLGILVRSPEPFNDPKMPTANLIQTVRLSIDGASTALHAGLHGKDAACVFVTNADHSLNVPAGQHHFTFDYMRWNGTAHAIESSATAEFPRT